MARMMRVIKKKFPRKYGLNIKIVAGTGIRDNREVMGTIVEYRCGLGYRSGRCCSWVWLCLPVRKIKGEGEFFFLVSERCVMGGKGGGGLHIYAQ